MSADAIYVTQTRLPDVETFYDRVREIIDSRWITNEGQCVRQLEQALSTYLGCQHLIVCNNGTTALMLALHCAGLRGKKIAVTAFSYVATLSALLWIGCTPIFIDIDPNTLSMSPEQLEQAFTEHPDIAGVLPVHIYGLPCDDTDLSDICRKHKAKLIYDAAHAFGSIWHGRSLLDFGDYSICSFHATKLFHTVEGGCVIAHSEKAKDALSLSRAFGHRDDVHYTLGINAKMSELHAAMGLCLLPQTKTEIALRKKLHAAYTAALDTLPVTRPVPAKDFEWNYAYYPILLPNEKVLLAILSTLASKNIYPRRYFYPALTTLPYVQQWRRPCPVAEDAATRSLCLPLYGKLSIKTALKIASVIHEYLAV